MSPKTRSLFAPRDGLLWKIASDTTEEWSELLYERDTYLEICSIIIKYRGGEAVRLHPAVQGSYNVVYRLEYSDGTSAIMRIPIKGVVPFPDEKIRYEVATMRYVAAHTTIPVPHVYHFGAADENPTGLGPFIIMDYIEHHQKMYHVLDDPKLGPDDHPALDPAIGEEKLEFLYAQMANILLQLSSLRFTRIGSLVEDGENGISVKGRPLSDNMDDIVVYTDAPSSTLPCQTYTSSAEWYGQLADTHMAQLAFQHNNAIQDADDARDKYVARQLMRNLSAQERLLQDMTTSECDFRLFSEDFRPANVLIDEEMRIVGVIDWEFAYVAPAQFSFDPPWWLLLRKPGDWADGYHGWMKAYEPRLETFLSALEAEEKKLRRGSPVSEFGQLSLTDGDRELPLSQRMRDSWEKKTWLLNYAARQSWEFDHIWWEFLDEKYFGPNEQRDHLARLELLSPPQRKVMETFVASKVEEAGERAIVKWSDEEAAEYLAGLLV